ncbi:hypothetical protein Tco_0368964 [Tanacetum coccineum]
MINKVDIENFTTEQYLMLTQESQTQGMVRTEFGRMITKDIEDMTIAEYMEYEAEIKRNPWGYAKSYTRNSGSTNLEEKEDALIDILKMVVEECKSIYKKAQTPSSKTSEIQGVSFKAEEEEGESSETLPCKQQSNEINPGGFTLPCTIINLKIYVMADVGAGINMMPKLLFEHLKLTNFKKTSIWSNPPVSGLVLGIESNLSTLLLCHENRSELSLGACNGYVVTGELLLVVMFVVNVCGAIPHPVSLVDVLHVDNVECCVRVPASWSPFSFVSTSSSNGGQKSHTNPSDKILKTVLRKASENAVSSKPESLGLPESMLMVPFRDLKDSFNLLEGSPLSLHLVWGFVANGVPMVVTVSFYAFSEFSKALERLGAVVGNKKSDLLQASNGANDSSNHNTLFLSGFVMTVAGDSHCKLESAYGSLHRFKDNEEVLRDWHGMVGDVRIKRLFEAVWKLLLLRLKLLLQSRT